jgi:hypothetical protein
MLRAGRKTSMLPAMIPGRVRGRLTRKKVWNDPAPRSLAASMSLWSSFSMEATAQDHEWQKGVGEADEYRRVGVENLHRLGNKPQAARAALSSP